MKMRILSILLASSAMIFAADGNTASATVNAGITTVRPISITKTSDLHFGTFVVDGGGGIVTVNPDSQVRTAFGSGIWSFTGSGKPIASAAKFEVTGEPGYPFHFHAPLDVEMLHKDGGTQTWRVIAWVHESLNSNIPSTVNVGGALTLVAPKPGVYTGTFKADVNYL